MGFKIKISVVLLAAAMLFSCEDDLSLQKPGRQIDVPLTLQEECGEPYSTPLLAGQNTEVGEIQITTDGNTLYVTYQITEAFWTIEATHLDVEEDYEDLPVNGGGNPKIGHFEYSEDHNPQVTSYTYTIDVSDLDQVVIAAHAVVNGPQSVQIDQDALAALIHPDVYTGTFSFLGDPAYLLGDNTNAGPLTGSHPCFCVDLQHLIRVDGTEYSLKAVDSYSDDVDFLECMVDKPENLDNLNYLINRYFEADGFTGRELQGAIWTLMDDITPTSPTGGILWDQDLVDEIMTDVLLNGEGYEPGYGDQLVIIQDTRCSPELIPTGQNNQTTIIFKEVPGIPIGHREETAWGAGQGFPGNSWAMYIDYCID